jgi:protoporphyrinogen oxidase
MIAILGAGPCGLSAAYHLRQSHHEDFQIFEQSQVTGGLCRWFELPGGGSVDCGGHAFFTADADLRGLMQRNNGERLLWQPRRAYVAHAGRLVRYPLQAHLHDLPFDLASEYAEDFEQRPGPAIAPEQYDCFEPWLLAQFGQRLCDDFFIPYAEKLWARPIGELLQQSNADRIPRLTEDELRSGAARAVQFNRFPNSIIGVSRTNRFWDLYQWTEAAVADKINFGFQVAEIELDRQRVHFAEAASVNFSKLVSTLPLDLLCAVTRESQCLIDTAHALCFNSLYLVSFSTPAANLTTDALRIYSAKREVPFHKLVVQPLSEPHANRIALQAEVAFSDWKQVDRRTVVAESRMAVERLKIVAQPESLVFERLDTVVRAYPVATRDSEAARLKILAWFENRGVALGGRFGSWSYINSDQAWLQGRQISHSNEV